MKKKITVGHISDLLLSLCVYLLLPDKDLNALAIAKQQLAKPNIIFPISLCSIIITPFFHLELEFLVFLDMENDDTIHHLIHQ